MVAHPGGDSEIWRTNSGRKADLDAEVRACAEMLADEKMADGMPAAEARRNALAELGGAEQVKQAVRDERAEAGIEDSVAGHTVWIAATAPFARLRGYGAADHRDRSWVLQRQCTASSMP